MEWKVERDDGMEVDASNNGSSFLPEIDPVGHDPVTMDNPGTIFATRESSRY